MYFCNLFGSFLGFQRYHETLFEVHAQVPFVRFLAGLAELAGLAALAELDELSLTIVASADDISSAHRDSSSY